MAGKEYLTGEQFLIRRRREEAEKKGKEMGQARAESVCLEPAFDALPPILEKWAKRKTWFDAFEGEKERFVHMFKLDSMPLEAAFERGYVAAGQEWVRKYIKELRDDGLIKGRV